VEKKFMKNAKVCGFVGFVGTFGLAALVGCGGSSGTPAPTLVLSNDNAKSVASQALAGGTQAMSLGLPTLTGGASAFAPIATRALRDAVSRVARPVAAGQSTPCPGGGTMTTDGNITATSTSGSETITFAGCIQDAGGTDTLDGTLHVSGSQSGNSVSFSITVNLTAKTAGATVTEVGDLSSSFSTDFSSISISSNQIAVTVASPTLNTKLTLSNLDIHESIAGGLGGTVSVTESYSIDASQLGGRFTVDTNAALATGSDGAQSASGELEITGAQNSKLTVTVLGNENFVPPAGQGQIKVVLDTTTLYLNWSDVEAVSGGINTSGL
jgi:hypothetical protein